MWPLRPSHQHNSKRQTRDLSHVLLVPPQLRTLLLCLGDKPHLGRDLGTDTRPGSPLQGGGGLRTVLPISSCPQSACTTAHFSLTFPNLPQEKAWGSQRHGKSPRLGIKQVSSSARHVSWVGHSPFQVGFIIHERTNNVFPAYFLGLLGKLRVGKHLESRIICKCTAPMLESSQASPYKHVRTEHRGIL